MNNFGDGSSSTTVSPEHKYKTPGTYRVDLKISSDSLCESEYSKIINVFSIPRAYFFTSNVCDESSAQFKNISGISSGTLSFSWDFGDNSTSDLPNPEHLFPKADIYTVSLVAYSENLCTDTMLVDIEIYPNPVVDFDAEPVCDGYSTEFLNKTEIKSSTVSEYLWDFGDGTNSVQTDPTKMYLNTGDYFAKLSAYSVFGCTGSFGKLVSVMPVPLVDFEAENVCFNEAVNFINNTEIEHGILNYDWDFADGNKSQYENPVYNYSYPDTFYVKLIVESDFGCKDSLKRYVTVYELPKTYAGPDTTVSKGYPAYLSGSGADFYEWIPATGLETPYSKTTIALPEETTEYTLMATDIHNCINYDTVNVFILNDFIIEATNVLTPNSDGENDFWIIGNIDSYPGNIIWIYDRWGKLVFHTQSYDNTWNGTSQKNDILPDGAYYYVLKFDESDKNYYGAITILRN